MEKMIIGIIASAVIGLGAWNLNQTFNLSIEIENVKGKIDVLERGIKQLNKNKNNNKKKKKKNSIIQQSN
jgi:small neutral amino acid transporter SnatA (MarC family)